MEVNEAIKDTRVMNLKYKFTDSEIKTLAYLIARAKFQEIVLEEYK